MKNRLFAERPLPRDGADRRSTRKPRRTVTVNLTESPLGWLRSRGLVSDRQLAAGETLRADWEQAQLAPAVTMRWDAAPADKNRRSAPEPASPTARQIAARRRFDAALDAVGTGLTDLLWRIVCAGEGMRDVETALGWPARSARIVLGIALDRLADHYRLK